MCCFVEELAFKGKANEALGIIKRHSLEKRINEYTRKLLKDKVYDEAKDLCKRPPDAFEPMSKPKDKYISLPDAFKVDWIGAEEDIPKLYALLDEELIGVDSEWRPQLFEFHPTKPCLLQLSGDKTAFLIDLHALGESEYFNSMMCKVFNNPKSTIIGFSFNHDIREFDRKLPKLNFIKHA